MTPTRALRRVLRPVRAGTIRVLQRDAERRLLRRSQDVTAAHVHRSCLVVAPHQDDEVLGCGGAIALRRRAGTPVSVVWLTDGRHSQRSDVMTPQELAAVRHREAVRALRVLGVDEQQLHFLDAEDGTARLHQTALAEQVRSLVQRLQPDDVLVTSPLDGHPDHVAAGEVVRQAIDGLRPCPRVLEYPVWSWYDWPWSAVPARPREAAGQFRSAARWATAGRSAARAVRPSHVELDAALETKRAALREHRSQFENITGEAGWTTFGPDFAPRFMRGREWFFTA